MSVGKAEQVLQPHEKRLYEEQKRVSVDLNNLADFIETNPKYKQLSAVDRQDLLHQKSVMQQYQAVLTKRIRRMEVATSAM